MLFKAQRTERRVLTKMKKRRQNVATGSNVSELSLLAN